MEWGYESPGTGNKAAATAVRIVSTGKPPKNTALTALKGSQWHLLMHIQQAYIANKLAS